MNHVSGTGKVYCTRFQEGRFRSVCVYETWLQFCASSGGFDAIGCAVNWQESWSRKRKQKQRVDHGSSFYYCCAGGLMLFESPKMQSCPTSRQGLVDCNGYGAWETGKPFNSLFWARQEKYWEEEDLVRRDSKGRNEISRWLEEWTRNMCRCRSTFHNNTSFHVIAWHTFVGWEMDGWSHFGRMWGQTWMAG